MHMGSKCSERDVKILKIDNLENGREDSGDGGGDLVFLKLVNGLVRGGGFVLLIIKGWLIKLLIKC